ncbi:MAG: AarF/ABC1/UbiB kinase family protein [Candidatus Nitrosocaldaceae archaeon]
MQKRSANASIWRIVNIIFRLLPIIIRFKKDRKKWIRKEGKSINEKSMRKNAKRATETFISLGPSFIKLGQWLSTRADLLPQPWMEELSKLQDDVPPAPFTEVKPIIEKSLGMSIEDAFSSFDTNCISGASLGQVYRARYKEREVIVKVNRPNIERIIEEDIEILKRLLPLAIKFIDKNIAFSAESMFNQFIESIYEEINYEIEADNLRRIKYNLRGENVIIPDVIEERSTKNVLTLEYIQGIKVTDLKRLDEVKIDRAKLIMFVHKIFFKMLLKHDIFHADPHPGNLAVSKDGKLILYDFGMVGRLDNETRLKLIRLYLALVEKDPRRTVDLLISLGTLQVDANRYVIEKGIELAIKTLHGTKVDEMEVNALMELANKTMSRFPFRLPKQLALYMRMASMLEGLYYTLKVEFRFVKVLRELLEEEGLIREAYIEEILYSIENIGKNIRDAITIAPILKSYLENNMMNGNNKNRDGLIAASIVSSSLFISSSLLLQSYPIFGQIGFGIASAIIVSSIIINKFR